MDENSQRFLAENGGMLPTLRKLYLDNDLLESSQVVAYAKEVIADTRARPKTPFYTEMSQELATIYNQVLIGLIDPEAAVDKLDTKLKEVLLSHQTDAGG